MAKQGGGLESQLISGARFAAGPVVPIGSIASAGFEKGQKRVQAIQQAEFEKKKLEAQNYAKQRENTNKILDALYKNKEDIKVNGELLQGEWKNMFALGAMQVKLNQANLINAVRKGDLDKFSSLNIQDKTITEPMRELKQLADDYADLADAVDDVQANISSRVSPEKIAIVNGILQGDKKIIDQVAKQYDIPVKEVANKSILKKIGYVASDYSGAEALFTATQQAAQKAVNSGLEIDGYMNKVRQDLSLLMNKMPDEQIVSTAFDFLGKETPGYTSEFSKYIESDERESLKNFNEDDPNSMEKIREFVYDNFLQAAEGSYTEFRKGNEDKFKVKNDTRTTEADKKRAITYDNAFRKSTDISKFKEELGIPTNEAGIAIGDLQSIESKAKLDITSDNFSNLVNKLGFRISAIYKANEDDPNSEITSMELQEQGGTGKYEVVPGQGSLQFLKDIFRMQGINERDLQPLINNVLYGTFNKPENDKYSQYIKK